MRVRLNSSELSTYQRDGYVVREAMFSPSELTLLRSGVEHAAAKAAERAEGGREYFLDGKRFVDVGAMTVQFERASVVRVVEPVHDLHPALDRLVDDPRLTVAMQQLVGSERVTLWTDKLNLKRPHVGSGFGWHQDAPYWIHDSEHADRLPNVMILLDDADEQNGCFRIIRGSHTGGCLPGVSDGSQLGGFYTDPDSFDQEQDVPITAPAGSLVFFSPFVVHGSQPNPSDRARRALIYTYQPAGHPMLKSKRVRS